MIVRKATVADIRNAFACLSARSALELDAAGDGAGVPCNVLPAALIKARSGPGTIALLALCEPELERPGALFLVARGEFGQAEIAGFTTLHFDKIKRAFWIWAARRFLPEVVDRHAFQARCSVMEGHPAWLAMLERLGFRYAGEYETGGRRFIDLVRVRPSQLTAPTPA